MAEDYYRILQVDPDAHPEVIRAAFRALLRAVGKHPDRGGATAETQAIIEAWEVLRDPDRRRAYDQWRRAHSAAPAPAALPPRALQWITGSLRDHRRTAAAPFAAHFDAVLRGPAPLGGILPFPSLLYVKAAALGSPAAWPTIFTLWRAVRLARSGGWPYADTILLVAAGRDDLGPFLAEAARPRTRPSLNRCVLAVLTYPPPAIHVPAGARITRVLARLDAAARAQRGGSEP